MKGQEETKKKISRTTIASSALTLQHSSGSYCSLPGLDLNVLGVWAMGYTGKDVVVSILDDGKLLNYMRILKNDP